MAPRITRAIVRMYQVGFGDAFLLSFEYDAPLQDGRAERHILIDFGSTRQMSSWADPMGTIARLMYEHSGGGKIDVVVVTHRHKDHLSAFGDSDVVAALMDPAYPRLVVRPWTEDPELDAEATGAPGGGTHAAAPAGAGTKGAVGRKSVRFLHQLREGAEFAERVRSSLESAAPTSLAATVAAVADQVANKAAVDQLASWSEDGRGRYLYYGMASGIEEVVPGLTVSVLGPPTVDQHEAVTGQRSADDDEFWMFYKGLELDTPSLLASEGDEGSSVPDPAGPYAEGVDHTGRPTPAADAPPTVRTFGDPGPVRWLTDRMTRQSLFSLLRIVRILDDVLNNTSLILLFEIPTVGKPVRMLFPGDAQIENWEYALKFADDKEAMLDQLRLVDLYKVGHHGSRNATPRTLFNLWEESGNKDRPMVALMSTKSKVHGETKATAVPRDTLVAALDTRTNEHLYSTEGLLKAQPYVEAAIDARVGPAITVTDGVRRKTRASDD